MKETIFISISLLASIWSKQGSLRFTCSNKLIFRRNISTIINDTLLKRWNLCLRSKSWNIFDRLGKKVSEKFPQHCRRSRYFIERSIKSSFVAHSLEISTTIVWLLTTLILLLAATRRCQMAESKFKLQSKINYKINNKECWECCNILFEFNETRAWKLIENLIAEVLNFLRFPRKFTEKWKWRIF